MRRQRWLHRNQAVSVVNAYAEMMSKSAEAGRGKRPSGGRNGQSTKIPGSAMFNMLRGKGNHAS